MPTSRATRVTSSANARRVSTIALIVSASAATSPRASTVIFLDRSPPATAVATVAMPRTWLVRFSAMPLTLSVSVLPGAGHPADPRLAAELALAADLARHPGHLVGERGQLVDHRVEGVLQLAGSRPRASTVILRLRSPRATAVVDLGDAAHLAGEVSGHDVDRVGEVAPRPGYAGHFRLTAQPAFGCRPRAPPGSPRQRTRRVGPPSC